MTNIIVAEWAYQLLKAMKSAPPFVTVKPELDQDGQTVGLDIESQVADTTVITLRIGLRPGTGDQYKPSARCISSTALPVVDLIRTRVIVRAMSATTDYAMLAYAQVQDFVVWDDGNCPCDHCETLGQIGGVTCNKCKGEGRR